MSKILLINPNKWGRGITHIWIASHSGILKKNNHRVKLFDCSFFLQWSNFENEYNTDNRQYKPSNYNKVINYNEKNIYQELNNLVSDFQPDIIFWSALSSHIHGEGEYVNIENGYNLIKNIDNFKGILVTGGLQATASPQKVLEQMNKINYLIMGESEIILNQLANRIEQKKPINDLNGICYFEKNHFIKNERQEIISDLDQISPYDYSIFPDENFLRPYNGDLVNAVDFELSRGCIYSCAYCVETVIQDYYGFNEKSKNGAIKNAKSYLRNKSAKTAYEEISKLYYNHKITLFRCQDTNFLTIDRKMLNELAILIEKSNLKIKLYIETRPEGINDKSIELLKRLKVDGVGMGVELSSEEFREDELNRFASQSKTIEAFKLLKEANIKRTSYNVIGFPGQNEESIKSTIEFNKLLNPDNITVAFYSPYQGTDVQKKGSGLGLFNDKQLNVDGQLRSTTKDTKISIEILEYYKKNFNNLVRSNIV